jgi:hypothetical protein
MAYTEEVLTEFTNATLNDGDLLEAQFNQFYDNIATYIVANGGSAPIESITKLHQYLPPIGCVLPFIPGYFADGSNGTFTDKSDDVTLSANWKICAGAALSAVDSPLIGGTGRYLPNLSDDRFLMGATAYGVIGGGTGHYHSTGTLTITGGAHTHTVTDMAQTSALADSGDGYVGSLGTRTTTAGEGAHTHANADISGYVGLVTGGVNGNTAEAVKPKYLAVKYIMRVK